MRWMGVLGAAMVLATAIPAWAGAALVLRDGTVLEGEGLERTRDGLYLLTIAEGNVIPVPVSLVKELRLLGGEDPAPSGVKVSRPETLAGLPDPRPPRHDEQLRAFARPAAAFVRGAVETNWTPRSALAPDVSQFNPARWYRAGRDFSWTPTPAFRASQDVTRFSPVRWAAPTIDPVWRPADGWRPAIPAPVTP
jgi:hypothetical protein